MGRTNRERTEELSPTMRKAVEVIREHGGRIERIDGGFWTYPGVAKTEQGYPGWSVVVGTVRALEARGYLVRTHEEEREWCDARRLADDAPGEAERRERADLEARAQAAQDRLSRLRHEVFRIYGNRDMFIRAMGSERRAALFPEILEMFTVAEGRERAQSQRTRELLRGAAEGDR